MIQVIDETSNDLIKMIELDFGPVDKSIEFSKVFIDWLHYRARRISQSPRAVAYSIQVQALLAKEPAISVIANQLESGADVTPWLSDSVRKKISNPKADMMFNDWQIIHFHLGQVFVSPQKIARTDDLLFAYIASDRAIFLDVQPHRMWAMRGLLRILLSVSPRDMERAELKGALSVSQEYSDDELVQLRQAGISTMITIDGRVFMPGLGISSSGHSTRIALYMQRLLKTISDVQEKLKTGEMPPHIMQVIYTNIGLPVRVGVQADGNRFSIYDKNRQLELVSLEALE